MEVWAGQGGGRRCMESGTDSYPTNDCKNLIKIDFWFSSLSDFFLNLFCIFLHISFEFYIPMRE